ncbi:hypothetical protein FACS1894166_01080 [Bacilli bacterium]|nr:hypothetical protein FACS1894166_01080 [Bacilli bacterium]
MKKRKSLRSDPAKRKILLRTLVPLGCLTVTTAIVAPLLLIRCNNDNNKGKVGSMSVSGLKDCTDYAGSPGELSFQVKNDYSGSLVSDCKGAVTFDNDDTVDGIEISNEGSGNYKLK